MTFKIPQIVITQASPTIVITQASPSKEGKRKRTDIKGMQISSIAKDTLQVPKRRRIESRVTAEPDLKPIYKIWQQAKQAKNQEEWDAIFESLNKIDRENIDINFFPQGRHFGKTFLWLAIYHNRYGTAKKILQYYPEAKVNVGSINELGQTETIVDLLYHHAAQERLKERLPEIRSVLRHIIVKRNVQWNNEIVERFLQIGLLDEVFLIFKKHPSFISFPAWKNFVKEVHTSQDLQCFFRLFAKALDTRRQAIVNYLIPYMNRELLQQFFLAHGNTSLIIDSGIIPMHKSFLICYVPFYAQKVRQHPFEGLPEKIEIRTQLSEELFLKILYGRLFGFTPSMERLDEQIGVAYNLQLKVVKNLCEKKLLENLHSYDNRKALFEFADRYKLETVKSILFSEVLFHSNELCEEAKKQIKVWGPRITCLTLEKNLPKHTLLFLFSYLPKLDKLNIAIESFIDTFALIEDVKQLTLDAGDEEEEVTNKLSLLSRLFENLRVTSVTNLVIENLNSCVVPQLKSVTLHSKELNETAIRALPRSLTKLCIVGMERIDRKTLLELPSKLTHLSLCGEIADECLDILPITLKHLSFVDCYGFSLDTFYTMVIRRSHLETINLSINPKHFPKSESCPNFAWAQSIIEVYYLKFGKRFNFNLTYL